MAKYLTLTHKALVTFQPLLLTHQLCLKFMLNANDVDSQ